MENEPQSPTHAEMARTIVRRNNIAAMATMSSSQEGYPYNSLVKYILTDQGEPVLLLSDLAEHTRNLNHSDRAALLIRDEASSGDALQNGRVTLVGEIGPAAPDHLETYRSEMLAEHPDAEMYIDFDDFNFYRCRIRRVRYIGGFGEISWLDAIDYSRAAPILETD